MIHSIKNQISCWLFGPFAETLLTKEKIFLLACFLGAIACTRSIFSLSTADEFLPLNIMITISGIGYSLIYLCTRIRYVKGNYPDWLPLSFILLSQVYMAALWFIHGGLFGSIPMAFMIYMASFILLLPKKFFRLSVLIVAVNFALLSFLEYHNPSWVHKLTDPIALFIGGVIGGILNLSIISIFVSHIRLKYDEKQMEVSKQNTALKQSEEQLLVAIDKAKEGAKAKADFLSIMSHELRTPMNAVIGMTHLLMQENPNKEQFKRLEILKFSSDQLLVLINDILDFSKIEAGKVSFESISFNLKKRLNSIHQTLLPIAAKKELLFSIEIDREIPENLIGDPNRLAQIINNLTSNAIKFTEKGEVKIIATLHKYTPECSWVKFEIIDTGIGIPEDKLQSIFEDFSQASSDTTRKYGGTGLGLTITKRLLELQESQIHVDSQVGIGSNFHFTLKIKNSNHLEKAPSKATITSSSSSVQVLKPMQAQQERHIQNAEARILVAEDHKVNQLVIANFLKKWDIPFDIVEDGTEVLTALEEQDYTLILMDVQMPTMNGYEASKKVRAMPQSTINQIPIIGLTATTMEEVQREGMAAGFNGFVLKPFEPMQLKKVLKTYLPTANINISPKHN